MQENLHFCGGADNSAPCTIKVGFTQRLQCNLCVVFLKKSETFLIHTTYIPL